MVGKMASLQDRIDLEKASFESHGVSIGLTCLLVIGEQIMLKMRLIDLGLTSCLDWLKSPERVNIHVFVPNFQLSALSFKNTSLSDFCRDVIWMYCHG